MEEKWKIDRASQDGLSICREFVYIFYCENGMVIFLVGYTN